MQDSRTDWAAVRAEVEAGHRTRNAIAARHGVTPGDILDRATRCKWEIETDVRAKEHGLLFEKLYWALERQIDHLLVVELTGTGEHHAAALARLLQTMDRLTALQAREKKAEKPARSREYVELRERIVKRLAELDIR